jgi:hypothetical protein
MMSTQWLHDTADGLRAVRALPDITDEDHDAILDAQVIIEDLIAANQKAGIR